MIPLEDVARSATTEQGSLAAMAAEAKEFLLSHQWCRSIRRGYLDKGWEGILGVFWFEIEPSQEQVDTSMWVIVGDVPPAYICNDNPNGRSALEAYTEEMQRWIEAAMTGRPVDDLIPVNVPPQKESAEMLASRLDFIRKELLPHYDDYEVELK